MSALMTPMRTLLLSLMLASPMLAVAQVDAEMCGPVYIPGDFGPYDYRTDKYFLPVVERAHFTTDVELLLRGHSTARPGGDIHYTLSKFPNHHRALLSMMKLGQKLNTETPPDVKYPVECYFERALRFKRNDTVARLLYVQYLIDKKRRDEALAQVHEAARFAGGSALTHFNIGLSFFELKAYDAALKHAHEALKIGYNNQDLVNKLKAVGEWREPVAETPEGAASAASAP